MKLEPCPFCGGPAVLSDSGYSVSCRTAGCAGWGGVLRWTRGGGSSLEQAGAAFSAAQTAGRCGLAEVRRIDSTPISGSNAVPRVSAARCRNAAAGWPRHPDRAHLASPEGLGLTASVPCPDPCVPRIRFSGSRDPLPPRSWPPHSRHALSAVTMAPLRADLTCRAAPLTTLWKRLPWSKQSWTFANRRCSLLCPCFQSSGPVRPVRPASTRAPARCYASATGRCSPHTPGRGFSERESDVRRALVGSRRRSSLSMARHLARHRARDAFFGLTQSQRNAVVEFLKSLQMMS